jgi:hypothetical protein
MMTMPLVLCSPTLALHDDHALDAVRTDARAARWHALGAVRAMLALHDGTRLVLCARCSRCMMADAVGAVRADARAG